MGGRGPMAGQLCDHAYGVLVGGDWEDGGSTSWIWTTTWMMSNPLCGGKASPSGEGRQQSPVHVIPRRHGVWGYDGARFRHWCISGGLTIAARSGGNHWVQKLWEPIGHSVPSPNGRAGSGSGPGL